MSRIIIRIMFVLLIITSCETNYNYKAEKRKLQNIHFQIYRSIEEGNIDKAAEYMTDDWTIYSSLFGKQTKKEWVEQFIPNFLLKGSVSIYYDNIEWFYSPSMAYCCTEEIWKFNKSNLPHQRLMTTSIYEKRNGKWYSTHVHQSPKQ